MDFYLTSLYLLDLHKKFNCELLFITSVSCHIFDIFFDVFMYHSKRWHLLWVFCNMHMYSYSGCFVMDIYTFTVGISLYIYIHLQWVFCSMYIYIYNWYFVVYIYIYIHTHVHM